MSLNQNNGIGASQPPKTAFSDSSIPFAMTSSTGSSGQDESLDQTDLDQSVAATVGPCLAKLDPAVAQAVQQRFQVS